MVRHTATHRTAHQRSPLRAHALPTSFRASTDYTHSEANP